MKHSLFAAYTMGAVLIILFACVVVKHHRKSIDHTDPIIISLKKELRCVHPAIDHVEMYEGNRSYTINKEKVYLCLRDENGNYYDKNMLTFVILHELAHVLCTDLGHTDTFKSIFNSLIKRAIKFGKFNPKIPIITNYCQY